MSSTTLLHPGHPHNYPICSGLPQGEGFGQREQQDGRSIHLGERWASSFRDGLPTPPQTTMNSGSNGYAQAASNGTSQSHYIPMYQPTTNSGTYSGSNGSNRNHHRSGLEEHGSTSTASSGHDSGYDSKRTSNASIATYLQIPSAINNSQGSLSEFAADITCLFWFESGNTLRQIEESNPRVWATLQLNPDTTPSMGFRKWVTTILSTTQVTQNVILLALLFVYRLKKFNPGVSGKRGSEFRLFTIALMLGNKFLDDNTYTNKTWAEVSGIAVQEIHIMEVEFLSNMRYNLFVSYEEWHQEWNKKLAKFYNFLETVAKPSVLDPTRNILPLSPAHPSTPHKLPSPPSPVHATNPYTFSNAQQPHIHPLSLPPTLPPSPVRPFPDQHLDDTRKRSWDAAAFDDRPAKRLTGPNQQPSFAPAYVAPLQHSVAPVSMANNILPSAPGMPQLANTNRAPQLPIPRLQTTFSGNPTEGHPMQLPPPGRAMASVFHPAQQTSWTQPTTPTGNTPASMNLFANPIPTLPEIQTQPSFPGTPSRPSPTGSAYPGLGPGTRLSPSYFLTNRNSPYRPVRHVHTLLNPPPSSSLQNGVRRVNLDQMRYQPLSKNPTEQRAGVVPFLHNDLWANQNSIPPMNPGFGFHA